MTEELNSIVMSGNVASEVVLRYDPHGTAYAGFLLAQETERYEIVVYGTLAERCAERLIEGARVIVQGRLAWAETLVLEVVATRVQTIAQSDAMMETRSSVRVAQPSERTRPIVAAIARQVNAPPQNDPWG